MRHRKKRSFFGVVIALLLVIAVLLAAIDVTIYLRYYRSGWYKNKKNPAVMTDMTDPEDNAEFGRIYYSPVEEEHLVETDEITGTGYTDNEVLIVAADGVSRDQIEELASSYNAEIVGEIEYSGDYQLRLTTVPENIESVVESISADYRVASASPNYFSSVSVEGDLGEFYYGREWDGEFKGLFQIHNKSWGFDHINTTEAWNELYEHSADVSPVKVGVCDNGFSPNHPDLGFAEFFYDNYDDYINVPYKDKGHGTHVSGTLAANADDKIGICGVYPYGKGNLYGASMTGIKESSKTGTEHYTIMGLKIIFGELIVRNVKVINYSMGFNHIKSYIDEATGVVDTAGLETFWNNPSSHTNNAASASILGDFYDRMLKKGYDFVICASAGNDSVKDIGHLEAKYNSPLSLIEQSEYPDVYNRIIVVGALDKDLSIAEYSNGGSRTDIYAPGSKIFSTYIDYKGKNTYGNTYKDQDDHKDYYWSGTSMATPHVSGVAAMVWSANRSLTGAQVKDIILSNPNPSDTTIVTLDAYSSVLAAFGLPNDIVSADSENGAVFGFVVKKGALSQNIQGAQVTLTGKDSDETYTGITDAFGHFEISAPEGQYIIQVKAKGYKDYKPTEYIPITKCQISYLGKLKLKKGKSSLDDEKYEAPPPEIGRIYTPDSLRIFFPEGWEDYDKIFKLLNVKAWTFYDGNLYAILDRSIPPSLINLLTSINDSVHLITVGDEGEQKLAEALMTYGSRDIYSSGSVVDSKGNIFCANGEDNEYTNWKPGCPNNYVNKDSDDIITVYRGPGDLPKANDGYGSWIDKPEFEYGIFVNDDTGFTSGIIIEIELESDSEE